MEEQRRQKEAGFGFFLLSAFRFRLFRSFRFRRHHRPHGQPQVPYLVPSACCALHSGTMVVTRVSYISSGLTNISHSILCEIAEKKATHVTLHSNQVCSLEVKPMPTNTNNAIHLKHLVDLDLSSNTLHMGYALRTFGEGDNGSSLMAYCRSLVKLNLEANGFTSKSFGAFVEKMPILPQLTLLDISQNNISKLPSPLKEKFPSLRNLGAVSNRIQSLSSLLNSLYRFRGQLECLRLSNQKGSCNPQPVCSATLYREKIIFVLGDSLKQLDYKNVSENEREQVRIRLSVYSSAAVVSRSDEEVRNGLLSDYNTPPPQHHLNDLVHHTDGNNATSSDIEDRVEFLSNLIEKQAHITNGLLEVAQSCHEKEIEMYAVVDEEQSQSDCAGIDAIEMQVDHAAATIALRKTTACALVKLALLKEEQRQTVLRMTFARWILSARFRSHLQSLESQNAKSKERWKGRANDLVAKAVQQQQEIGLKALREVEAKDKVAQESILQLTKQVGELEMSIQSERSKYYTFQENAANESDRLRNNLKKIEEEQEKSSRMAAVEIESVRCELQQTQEKLEKEKANNARLETMYNQATSKTLSNSNELDDLRTEIITKDSTIKQQEYSIKQLKAAYEQAATRAASDRSKCEQVLSGERHKSEVLKTYTKKIRSLESDNQNLVAIRADLESEVSKIESQLISMQQMVQGNASTISNLTATIDEKDCKLESLVRRLKYVSDESDDIQHQLTECKRVRTQLQSQLDRANDELNSNRCSAEAHQIETLTLQQNLESLRQNSQLREKEMSANVTTLRREYQDRATKQAKLIKSLGVKLKACETREADLTRSHRLELQDLSNYREQEVRRLQETLANESKCNGWCRFRMMCVVEMVAT